MHDKVVMNVVVLQCNDPGINIMENFHCVYLGLDVIACGWVSYEVARGDK